MKILYILGAYKPRASANGICSENIIQGLVGDGHEVTVISNRLFDCPEFVEDSGVKIHRIKPRLYIRVTDWLVLNKEKNSRVLNVIGKAVGVLNKLKMILSIPTWPFVSPLYCYRFYKKAAELQKKEHFDKVISVYTPIDCLYAGYKLKKKFPEIGYIPYFLDSLSGGYGPKYFSEEQIIKRGLKIERKIFSVAEKVVLMESSKAHHLKYNESFKNKLCFLDIPMLKEQRLFEKTEKTNTVKFLFVGSVSSNVRNPDTLISALKEMKNKKIVCEFVGNITCKDKFFALAESFGERLVFTDFINHEELAEKFAEADVLINIGNLVSTMVPSKIFEYMSYGKPIISTFDIPGEPSKKYLEKYPLALLLSGEDSPERNAEKIESFISDRLGETVNFEELKKEFYLNTPQAFISEVRFL